MPYKDKVKQRVYHREYRRRKDAGKYRRYQGPVRRNLNAKSYREEEQGMVTDEGIQIDAIASRMVATFKYETPEPEQAAAIWKILATQFEVTLSDKLVAQLVSQFNTASGRDIKQLLKLTMKYCNRKKKKMDLAVFKTCAMFRGIA